MSTGIYVGLSSGNVGIGTGGINSVGSQLNVNGDISAGFLIGQVSFFTMNTAPTGWLKCNGAAISRTTYAKLFAVTGTTYGVGNGSTTFNLPDLRGDFIRGWDDARAIDSGRTFGTAQSDTLQGHQHDFKYSYGSGGSDGVNITTGVFYGAVLNNYTQNTGAPITNGANGAPRTATETRPRNIALLACIKY